MIIAIKRCRWRRHRSFPTPLDPYIFSQAHFLSTAYSLFATADFPRLLFLQGAELGAVPEASALHSLLSSISPQPTPPAFSLELTAALLPKDKMNAFGVMEPFREEDCGERRVRAYVIYPNASFNHDCLPNACRFDYIDNDTERNTDILVRAIHDIPAGREVCISYFPVNWRYTERHRRLLEDYGFRCVCDRCEVEKNWKDGKEDGGAWRRRVTATITRGWRRTVVQLEKMGMMISHMHISFCGISVKGRTVEGQWHDCHHCRRESYQMSWNAMPAAS